MRGRKILIRVRNDAEIGSIQHCQGQASSYQSFPGKQNNTANTISKNQNQTIYQSTSICVHISTCICVHAHLHTFPFLSQAEVIDSQPLKFLESHSGWPSHPVPWPSLCITVLETGSSVQVSTLTRNFSQSILAHLFEIKTTKEQSINKWSAVPTLLHFATLGKKIIFPTPKCTLQ